MLDDQLYALFRDMLLQRVGLYYPERKRGDLQHCLEQVLRITGRPSLQALYSEAQAGGVIWDTLVEQLTIGETYFFRNNAQFEALRRHILPELIGRRREVRYLRLWSAGCASGEEPYSLAITVSEALAGDSRWQVSLLASDLNPAFLERARQGIYGEWSFRETSPEVRVRYFLPEGRRWQLRPEIRSMVTFSRLNLVEANYPSISSGTAAIDLIFCRNVMIYFDEPTIRQIVDRFYRALAPGGWLVVGHAEPQARIYGQFEVHNYPDTVIYRKPLNAPLFAFDPERGVFDAGSRPLLSPGMYAQTPVQPAPLLNPPSAALPRTSTHDTPPQRPAPVLPLAPAPPAPPPPEPVAALIARGRSCADHGQWGEARRLCEQALARDPLEVAAHYLLAQIDEHEGRLNEALAGYRRTVYLDRTFVAGTLGMANILRQTGHRTEANRTYQRALKQLDSLEPDTPVPGIDDACAADLIVYTRRQIAAL